MIGLSERLPFELHYVDVEFHWQKYIACFFQKKNMSYMSRNFSDFLFNRLPKNTQLEVQFLPVRSFFIQNNRDMELFFQLSFAVVIVGVARKKRSHSEDLSREGKNIALIAKTLGKSYCHWNRRKRMGDTHLVLCVAAR